jgi:hypothetical protein
MVNIIRRELTKSQIAGQEEDIQFDVEEVEVTLSVALTGTSARHGGFNLGVLTATATAESLNNSVHHFTIRLTPANRAGDPRVRLGSESLHRPSDD